MLKQILSALLLLGFISLLAQSPHGVNLKISCSICHDPSGWSVNSPTNQFDHNKTEFELEGAHAQTKCIKCHTSLVFDQTPSECISCHTDIHNMLAGNECNRCHTSESWLVNNIAEIHEENGFPLIGIHSTLNCEECHLSETNLRFDRIGNDCFNCHREDYLTAQNPNHINSGFSTNCIECHDILEIGWRSGNYTHDFFPLTAGHNIQDCKECHKTNSFSGTSPECITCHKDNYNQSNNPSHQALGINTDCSACHTTHPGWNPARFDNHNEYYQFNGAHALISDNCGICHNGDYNNTPNTCVGCHQNDYNNTTNPSHSPVGFSTACNKCHMESSWTPATFDHDAQFFPIYSGKHRESWGLCTDCHSNTSNYSDFSCFTCHKQSTTNNDHSEVSGYQYLSIKCLDCHPDGSD